MKQRYIALAAIIFAAEAAVLAHGLAPHPPIVIATDADFTPENGVVGGTGTRDDPFVIAGWEIEAGNAVGISVRNTTAHFVIRDCRVTGRPRGTGISLVEVRGGRVERCELSELGVGVFIYRSKSVRVEGSSFIRCRRGIEGTESPGFTVEGNLFLQTKKEGIFLWHCHDGIIRGNRFRGGRTAAYLDSCHRDRLEGNAVGETEWGLFLWDSFDCVIVGNLLQGCRLGVALVHTSARNLVFHNAFLECERPAACDGPGNRWDNGYPSGGNFWGGVELTDRLSGPDQDEAGSDGIGDSPVEVPLACTDRYPLTGSPPEIPMFEEGR